MLLKKATTYTLILLLCNLATARGLDFTNQTFEVNGKQVKAVDLVKDIGNLSKNKHTRYIQPIPAEREYGEIPNHNDSGREVCIECEELSSFANQIADIISEHNKSSPNESIQIRQEAFKLKAVASYIEIVDKVGDRNCYSNEFETERYIYQLKDFEDFELMFTSEADLKNFDSLSIHPLSDTTKLITWFRATDEADEDIFVKVVNIKGEQPYFQIYYANDSFVDPEVAYNPEAIPELVTNPELETDYIDESAVLRDREYNTPFGQVKINKALYLRQQYYIPTAITLIEMETESSITEDTSFKTKVKIDGEEQSVQLKLDSRLNNDYQVRSNANISSGKQVLDVNLDRQGQSFARAQARGDGYYLAGVTVATPAYRNLEIETDLSYDSNNTARIQNDFRFHGVTVIKTGTIIQENGDVDFTTSQSFNMFENARITMQLQHSTGERGADQSRTSAYVSLDMKF